MVARFVRTKMYNILFCLMLSIHFVTADVDSDDFEAVDRFKRYYYHPLRYSHYPIDNSGIPSINAYKKYQAYQGDRQAEGAMMHDGLLND
ncbi:hypothetical protein M514_11119 [Trichuris suis]|uniref:Uncharacterized protein n=1 Tax=Trichuris suis TaxID=68888 RepID=A0A085LSP5_9BILA|nr:hypothetical protein M513_11119 [Trichuris suis]KFD63206.1 hypothetical protein M514_11119 [Trichuris suis]KHJ41865.1 hypothetical protein D918_08081 [Trichuris suis]